MAVKQPILKVKLLNDKGVCPQRMTDGAAGYDITCPERLVILPQLLSSAPAIVHTGFAVEIPEGYYGQIVLRSSMGKNSKIRMANQVSVIDSDYRGEVLVYLENLSNHIEVIKEGQRFAQLILTKIITPTVEVVDVLSSTARGEGATGSTGKGGI
jgi:dUTP pyrophosphatase